MELAIRDLKDQALAHFPSGSFATNAAWTVIACLAHNMARWVGQLGLEDETWRAARTIRRWLIALPAGSPERPGVSLFTYPPAGPGGKPSSRRLPGSGRAGRGLTLPFTSSPHPAESHSEKLPAVLLAGSRASLSNSRRYSSNARNTPDGRGSRRCSHGRGGRRSSVA